VARSDSAGKELLKRAMSAQVQERSLQGYRELATAWVAAEAQRSPETIAQGLRNAGADVRVTRDGAIIVNHPAAGETELVSGLRAGILRLGR
jgi:hypothetical protein